MRRSSQALLALVAFALCSEASAGQITNGPQPGGSVVRSERGRERNDSGEARPAGLSATETPNQETRPVHADEQPVMEPLRAAAPGSCVISVSVICWDDGGVVAGWSAAPGR